MHGYGHVISGKPLKTYFNLYTQPILRVAGGVFICAVWPVNSV